MQSLLEGHEHFRAHVFPEYAELFARLESQQQPRTLFLTCSDSRIVPDLILQTDPGELFICRNAGNIVPPHGEDRGGVSATIEYAVCALGVENIVICGHSDCGAMKAVANGTDLRAMPTVAAWLGHAESARQMMEQSGIDPADTRGRLRAMTRANVVQQLTHLRSHPSVASRLQAGSLILHGWVYDIPSGALEAFDAERSCFRSLQVENIARAVAQPRLHLTA